MIMKICNVDKKEPLEGLNREDRNSGSCVQDLKFGKHGIFLEGMFGWLLLIFVLVYQIGSQQIYQNDCMQDLGL